MKNYLKHTGLILLIFAISSLLSSCEFDLFKSYDDEFPSIEITNVSQSDFSTIVSCKMDKNEGTDIEYFGICFNETGNPEMAENQALFNKTYDVVQVVLEDLTKGKTYYFKAFAANESWYATSNEYAFYVPYTDVSNIPCTVETNTIVANNNTYDLVSIQAGDLYSSVGYGIVAESDWGMWGTQTIKLEFTSEPITGIYSTCSYSDIEYDDYQVYVTMSSGTNSYTVDVGDLVYIENTGQKISVTFCELDYTTNFENTEIKGNIEFTSIK